MIYITKLVGYFVIKIGHMRQEMKGKCHKSTESLLHTWLVLIRSKLISHVLDRRQHLRIHRKLRLRLIRLSPLRPTQQCMGPGRSVFVIKARLPTTPCSQATPSKATGCGTMTIRPMQRATKWLKCDFNLSYAFSR